MIWFLLAAMAVFGAAWRRWLGGGYYPTPRVIKFAVYAPVVALALSMLVWWPYALALAAGVSVAWMPGHASYQGMGRSRVPDNEYLRDLLRLVFPLHLWDSRWYDFTGMSVRYGVFTVGTGAALVQLGQPQGWLYIPAGALVAAVYLGAWELQDLLLRRAATVPWGTRLQPTVVGEYGAGAILTGLLFLPI